MQPTCRTAVAGFLGDLAAAGGREDSETSYPKSLAALQIFDLVSGLMCRLESLLMTRETVEMETPTCCAMSFSVGNFRRFSFYRKDGALVQTTVFICPKPYTLIVPAQTPTCQRLFY
jgi:hypothetical protein